MRTVAFTLLILAAPSVFAFNDPANDFISTYQGLKNPDVDVLSASVAFDGLDYIFETTMAGNIGQSDGALYVWGFNRGAGTARFSPAIPGTEDILFDSVVIMRPDTTLTVNRIVGGGSTNFGIGTVSIAGATMTARVAATELPTQGFALTDYTYNLWPRIGSGNNNQISDFAPDNTNAKVDVVPEPMSLTVMTVAVLAGLKKRKRQA